MFLIVIIGDFNTELSNWFKHNKVLLYITENISSQFGLHQVINRRRHISYNSFSCIDLFVTSKSNSTVQLGFYSSVHPNCYHQVILAKFILQLLYPRSYSHEVWPYKDANIDLFSRVGSNFNLVRAFTNTDINSDGWHFQTCLKHCQILFRLRKSYVTIRIFLGWLTKGKNDKKSSC